MFFVPSSILLSVFSTVLFCVCLCVCVYFVLFVFLDLWLHFGPFFLLCCFVFAVIYVVDYGLPVWVFYVPLVVPVAFTTCSFFGES